MYSEDGSSLSASEDDLDTPSQPERGVYITDQSAATMIRPPSGQSSRPTSMPVAQTRRDNGSLKQDKIDKKVQKLGMDYRACHNAVLASSPLWLWSWAAITVTVQHRLLTMRNYNPFHLFRYLNVFLQNYPILWSAMVRGGWRSFRASGSISEPAPSNSIYTIII